MRLASLISISLFSLVACATEPTDGELPIDGDASQVGKADGTALAVEHINPIIGNERLERGGTAILTSAKAWRRVMGSEPPADVDFTREWVAFFGTGLKNTGGFSAEVTELRLHADVGALVVGTHATSPGFDCLVTQAFTTPHDVVKFAIPSLRPLFALADASSEIRRCSPSNEERLQELADSRATWEAAKAAHGNSYVYVRDVSSFTGFSARTTITVANGVVVQRDYKAQHISGGDATVWTETGADVGSHTDEGLPAVLFDALYDDCQTRVLTQDENTNFMSFSTDQRGLLQVCTFTPMGCQDDCSRGPVISSLEF